MAVSNAPGHLPERFKESRWDLALALVLLSLGAALLRAVYDPAFWRLWLEPKAQGPAIGAVTPAEAGSVRLKMAASQLWRDLDSSEGVGAGDTVLTDGSAGSRLRVGRFPEALLAPNSLIVVEELRASSGTAGSVMRSFFQGTRDDAALEVSRGGLRVALTGGVPIQVRLRGRLFQLQAGSGGGTTEVTADSISLSGSTGELRVQELGAAAPAASLRAGQTAVLDPGGGRLRVQENAFALTAPEPGKVLFLDAAEPAVFRWERRGPGAGGPAWLILRSLDEKGGAMRIPVDARQGEVSRVLPEGAYEWFLEWGEGRTAARSLTRVDRVAPAVSGPSEGAMFEADPGSEAEIPLLWEPIHPRLRAEVEWRPLGGEARSLLGERGGVALKAGPGAYEWRARAVEPALAASPWSAWRRFRVGSREDGARWTTRQPPAARGPGIEILPTVESTAGGASTRIRSADDLQRIEVILSWKPIAGASSYLVRVYKPDGAPWVQERTADPRLKVTVTSLKGARYEYEVSARLASGKSVSSGRVPVAITFSAPLPLLPAADARVKPGEDVLMTWEKTSLTQYYQLQISENPRFDPPLVLERALIQNFFGFAPPRPGTYYWRLRSHGEGRLSAWSSPRSFTAKRPR